MRKIFLLLIFFTLTLFSSDLFRVGNDSASNNALSKKDIAIAGDIWLTQMASEINLKSVTKVYENPEEMAQDLADGKLDYIASFGLTFVKYLDLSLLEDGFSQGFLNGEKEVFVFVAPNESPIRSLADISNETISMQKDDSVIKLYLKEKAQKNSSPNIELYPTRQRALLKLFFGQAKVAVTTNKSFALAKELNPQIGKKLKIIETTNLQATPFGLLSKATDAKIKKQLLKVSKEIHKTPKGKQLLMFYKTEVIVDSKLKDLQPFQELYEKTK